jgi:RNA polymerase sigma-70 factor, ECF subfamily
MIASEARGAWNEIESRLRPYVARRVASPDVDDVVQEIFVKIQGGMANLRDGERFGGWVYRIAQNVIADFGRARSRDPLARTTEPTKEPDSAVESQEDAALQADLGECVALFVARLPSPYREAITLTELEGLTQKDAADMLGISLSGMKSRVQRGREKIRDMFEDCCRISVDGRGKVVDCQPRALEEVPEDCRGAAIAWVARRRQ